MIRLGFALGWSLLLVIGVAMWAPSPRELPELPEREAVERSARAQLSELREVASTWLEVQAPPAPPRAPEGSGPPVPVARAQPPAHAVERVAPHGRVLADAKAEAGEWSEARPPADATPVEAPPEQQPEEQLLGAFEGRDLDESAGIVRRLLAVYARLERSQ